MKNYQEIYEKIENPLNDDEVVRKLIEGYSDELGTEQYYKKLVQVNYKEKKYKDINMEDKDRLVSQIFNDWKKDLTLNIKDDEIKKYNKDFPYLREFLKNTPYVKSAKEFFKIQRKVDVDEQLETIYSKYTPFSHGESWTYISHNSINPSKYKKFIVDHRLYLNTENIDTYKVMELFRNKCKERELDYHFKFSDNGDRDDTIVIYSDDKKLSKYLEILEEIKKEEPEIVKRAQTPPMLTGKIDGWIGYGSEPKLDEDGKNTNSFNSVRSGIIQNAISKETIKWIRENKELTKEDTGLNEYLTKQIYDDIIKDKYRMYKSVYEPEFQEKILKKLENDIAKNKSEILEGRFDGIKEFNIDDINIEVDSEMIQRAFRPFSKKILKKDPSFLGKVRDAIKEEGLANGIDSEKFCFDIDKRDKLFNEDKTNEILETIDPQFLNKKIKFAGFAKGHDEIEYERYIRAVVKELPKDKNIIMKDGRQLTPKQFIENEIPKLEQKYNINIKKLLEENIIIEKEEVNKNRNANKPKNINDNNKGLNTKVDNFNNKKETNDELFKNINPAVLNQKVKIGAGKEITYEEYLKKYVIFKIPKGEKVKIKNGIEIPKKQYIEEVLLQEKENYGLDVDSMLEKTLEEYIREENDNKVINNTPNNIDLKRRANTETKIINDRFKENTKEEPIEKKKVSKVLLETEKTNLPMKIGFFEKIKQGFKKIKEIAHKVKEWVDKKKDSFFRENIKLVDIDLEELEKSETNDNLNKPEEKEIVEDKENKKVEKTIVEEEKERNNIINEEKEVQDNMNYKKITNSEILQNEAVKEKIEEYMKNLNDKVKNSSNSQKHDKDLDR
jgi:hypothetical protein